MAEFTGLGALVKVDTNNVGGAGANWVTIGQSRDFSHPRGSQTVSTTHRGNAGWQSSVVTSLTWGVSVDCALDPSDSAFSHVRTRWLARLPVYVQIDASALGGLKEEGAAVVTSFPAEYPVENLASYSVEFQGTGALSVSP